MKGSKEVLTWTIEKLVKGEETTIEYSLHAESDKAHVKDAQFSM
jgi:hypothetical protein